MCPMFRVPLVTLGVLVALVDPARAATRFVAVNGIDADGCGTKASPCRSISHALDDSAAGDTIVVGPGRYGSDLDGDAIFDEPGEEHGFPFCGCAVGIDRAVTIVSSAGAAATVIDNRNVPASTNVFVIGENVVFGKPGKGFTITATKDTSGDGLLLLGANIKAQGNQAIADALGDHTFGAGITTHENSTGPIVVEGNQAIGWSVGLSGNAAGTIIRKNVATLNSVGVLVRNGALATGNVTTANGRGIFVSTGARAIGNATIGNRGNGVEVRSSTVEITANNIFGNAFCGTFTDSPLSYSAIGNYFGAATGPGPDPADLATTPGYPCNKYNTSVTVLPFATKPFKVKAPIKP